MSSLLNTGTLMKVEQAGHAVYMRNKGSGARAAPPASGVV